MLFVLNDCFALSAHNLSTAAYSTILNSLLSLTSSIDAFLALSGSLLIDDFSVKLTQEEFLLVPCSDEVNGCAGLFVSLLRKQEFGRLGQEPNTDSTCNCEDTSKDLERDPIVRDEPIVDHSIDSNHSVVELEDCTN